MSNDKKQLLNESTVRRFMGLAGIGALSNNFVNEKSINEQEDVLEETEPPLEEQPLPTEMSAGPPPVDDEGPPVDDEGSLEEEPVQDIDLTREEADVLIELGKKLEEESGVPPEGEELGASPEGMPPEGAMGMMPPGMAPPVGAGPPMQEALVRELTSRVANRIKKEHVVNEVMKRVATRLKKSSK